MARTTFDGPVVSKNGFQGTGPAMTRTIAAGAQTIVNTLTVPAVATEVLATDVAGKVFVKSDAAATTITLPAIISTADGASAGPGSDPNNTNNIGMKFEFFGEFTVTGDFIIKVANANEEFIGFASTGDEIAQTNVAFIYASEEIPSGDTLTLNGGTTGGVHGFHVTCQAISATRWAVNSITHSTGVPVTPFSATV